MIQSVVYNSDTASRVYRDIADGAHLAGFDAAIAALEDLIEQAAWVTRRIEELIRELEQERHRLQLVRQEIERYLTEAEEKMRSASEAKKDESESDRKARQARFVEASRAVSEHSAALARIPDTGVLQEDMERLESFLKPYAPFQRWVHSTEELLQSVQRAKEEATENSQKLLTEIESAMMCMENYCNVRI